MTITRAINEIGIVLYGCVQAACVHGLTDLFGIAAAIASDQQRDGRSALRVTHWEAAPSRDVGFSCVHDSDPRGEPKPRILIIPPTMMDLPDPDVPAGVVAWLRSRHERGAMLVSVCSGAFILAATGVAAGRAVSTHRICAEALAKRFPAISVDPNERIIDHGDVMSAGGFMAWVDVGLLLVDRMLGGAVRADGSLCSFRSSRKRSTLFCWLRSHAGARRHGRAEGSGVGAHQGWTRHLSRLHGGGGASGKADVPPPVRQCNRHDTN